MDYQVYVRRFTDRCAISRELKRSFQCNRCGTVGAIQLDGGLLSSSSKVKCSSCNNDATEIHKEGVGHGQKANR